MRKKTIVFQVYDKDTFSKDDAIGEVQVPLWTVDLSIETDVAMELGKATKGKDNKPRSASWKQPKTQTAALCLYRQPTFTLSQS